MENEISKNKKFRITFCSVIFFMSILIHIEAKKTKKKKNKKKLLSLLNDSSSFKTNLIPPSDQIILPPSSSAINNLNYCLYYTPKDKEFKEVPLKYEHGISIIITAYKMVKYIKETLDSILNQIWFNMNENWEILLGVDGCEETLNYLHSIRKNYKNLRVFMMKKNKGTYITTNTIMSIAKYDNLVRFDSDDIMNPNFIEVLMEESESDDIDKIVFKMENFGYSKEKQWACGQFLIKHWVFDWFGGFLPWPCSGDIELHVRIDKFIKLKNIPKILMRRRIHNSNLTVSSKTGMKSNLRRWYTNYVRNISRKIKNINDAIIIKVVDDYDEIFPDTCLRNNDEIYFNNLNI